MKERPILFNSEMVNAILSGRKTQTRRIMRDQPEVIPPEDECGVPGYWIPYNAGKTMVRNEMMTIACPLGPVGDRLWVREAWQVIHDYVDEHGNVDERRFARSIPKQRGNYWHPVYAASWGDESREDRGFPWRPSIHMPRWASRINLLITGVRVERLRDISEQDAMAEGVSVVETPASLKSFSEAFGLTHCPKISAFANLWQSIYGSWGDNPWVWVIEFEQIKGGEK